MVTTGDLVIVGNDGVTGSIFAFDQRTGDIRWQYDAGSGGVQLDLLLVPPRVYAVTPDEGLLAIDVGTGRVAWRSAMKPAPWASPASDGKRIYVAAADGVLHAWNAQDGSPAWQTKLEGLPSSSVAVANGDVYAGTSSTGWDDPWEMSGRGTHLLYRVNASSGNVLSALRLPAKPLGIPLIGGKGVVVVAGEDLASADKNLKAIRWRTRAPTFDRKPRPQLRGDVVYLGVEKSDLVAINIGDGSIQSRQAAEGAITTFRVDDGQILIGAKQKLWAYAAKP